MNTPFNATGRVECGFQQMTDEQAQATTGGWGEFYVTTSFEFVNIDQSDRVAVNINNSDYVAVNIDQSDRWF